MRVLLLEGEAGAGSEAAAELVAAGHEVARCHEPGAAVFPCNGLDDEHRCPIETEAVDVALVARREAHDEPTASEDGVSCALRCSIPLVVLGQHQGSPFVQRATAVSAGPETVVDAVELAAGAQLPRHVAAATEALRGVLDRHGLTDVEAAASVVRRGNDLMVRLHPSRPVPAIVNEMASVRAVTAIRAFDPYPSVIDVVLQDPAVA